MNELNHLLSGELTVTVNTGSGTVLTGQLRAPWMPTPAPSPAAPTTSAPTSAPQGIDFGNGVGINDKIIFVEEQAVGIHIASRPHRIFVHTPQGDSIKECTVRLS